MRLMIDGGGYATVATAFEDANQVAAMQYDALAGRLGGYAGMAGDDAVAADFAEAYDGAAAEALAGFADLVEVLATLGRLTEASLENHRRAEEASVIPGPVVYDGTALPPLGYATVLPATPPTALGSDGDPVGLAPAETWILDHLEGVFWPDADTARLREAAHTWRSAADGLRTLTDYTGAAARGLGDQVSPEVPLAVAATDDVTEGLHDLADQYAAIATACDTYAEQVDARRAEMRALLAELLAMVVEGVLLSVAIGALTAGSGAAATGAAAAARVAAQSPRFAAILSLLRSVVAGTATGLRATREALALRRLRFVRYLSARAALRGERGAVDLTRYLQRGFLRRHEARPGGHLLAQHSGRSRKQLAERLSTGRTNRVSTFDDQAHAEDVVADVLQRNRGKIDEWLKGEAPRLRIDQELGRRTGVTMSSDGTVSEATAARVILTRDPHMPLGWRVLTGFPEL